jgi:hypothetical protein
LREIFHVNRFPAWQSVEAPGERTLMPTRRASSSMANWFSVTAAKRWTAA